MISFVVLAIVISTAFYIGFQMLGKFLIVYKFNHESLDVKVFGFPFVEILYADIATVEEITFRQTLQPNFRMIRLVNRIVGNAIIVRKKSGLRYMITPDDVPYFAGQLRARLAHT